MATKSTAPALECVADDRRAALLMHPLRARLLVLAREPASATELAARLGLSRQAVNYHVRALARARFLRPAGHRRKRNMIERRYVATARAYVLAPPMLAPLGAEAGHIADAFSADRLLAAAAQVQRELTEVRMEAAAAGRRVATLSIAADVRFESASRRAEFAAALRDAVIDVVGRYSAGDAAAPGGRSFRLVVGCYPKPAAASGRRRAGASRKENA